MKHKIESINSEIIFLNSIRHDMKRDYIFIPNNESGEGNWYFDATIAESIKNRLDKRIARLRELKKYKEIVK